ncbi:universal stress protein A-like protein isoform X2 [Euphorbia lathyris]|uniref:universal stress protein A-like protein isoform X2 n=1 Tax=Euphorbia lathyris TaxID=212925 RepID=UPI003313D042
MESGGEMIGKKKMKVMVAIDESEGSFYALQWTLDNLINSLFSASNEPSIEGGLITLIHVQQPFSLGAYPVGPGGGAVVESVKKAQQETSAALLSRALNMCSDKMVKAETLVVEGDAKDMICQATEQNPVDLLVVGSRGLGKIKRAFLGSVSDYCSHHAKCPILIVRPPREILTK